MREKGYFVAPTLLVADDPHAGVFHAEEVFGPVASLLPYSGEVDQAVALVARGGGSLVTSVYSNDVASSPQRSASARGAAGWLGSDKMAEQSLPPGMVLPAMIHGGPARRRR